MMSCLPGRYIRPTCAQNNYAFQQPFNASGPLACVQRHCAVFSPSCLTGFFLLWNSTDLEWRGCKVQLCMHMFEVLSLMKLSLIPCNTYHGFPTCKTCHTITTTNVPTLNVTWKLALALFLLFVSTNWWNVLHDLSLWLCDGHNGTCAASITS